MKKVILAVAALLVLAYGVALYQHRNFGNLQAEMTSRLYDLKNWIVAKMEGLERSIERRTLN